MIYTTPNTSLLTEVDAEGNPVCDFSQIVEDSPATVRKSLDGTLFIAKFMGETPTFFRGLRPIYSRGDISNSKRY